MSAALVNTPEVSRDLQQQLLDALEADQVLLAIAISYERDLTQALLQVDRSRLTQAQSKIGNIERDWAEHNQLRDKLMRQILQLDAAKPGSVSIDQLCKYFTTDNSVKAHQLFAKIKKNIALWSDLRTKNSARIRGGLALIAKLGQPLASQQPGTYAPPGRRR